MMESKDVVAMIVSADAIICKLRDELGEEGINLEVLGIDSELDTFDKFFKLADILPVVLGRPTTNKEVQSILNGETIHS